MSPPLLAAVYEPFSSGTTGDGLRFVHGELLWVWPVAVAALAGFFWWSWRRRRELVFAFVRSRLLAQLTVGVSARRQKFRLALLTAAAASILLALTRPQWGYDWEEARQKGLDIIVAIDTSRSMLAEDVPPNRFTRARLAALDLMRLARADRLGLVAFAGDAFLHCPLTLDDEAFRQSLEVLEVGIITQGGTALTTAIKTALSAFKAEGDNHRVLVLFTDGEDHDSEVDSAVEQARQAGLRIFTVGVGTAAGELLRVTDDQGVSSFVKDPQGNPVKSRLNESILQQIATSTGGFYLPLRGPEIMQTLYEKGLAPLPKSEHSTRLFRQYRERFQWPLGIALILLVAEMFLPERRRTPRPAGPLAAAAGTSQSLAALPIGLLLLVPTFSTSHAASPGQALRQYDSGRFSEARRNFQELIEKDPHDPRLHFNSGAAAYRDGKFEDAVRSFSEALTAPDLQLQQRAFYNLGNALYRLGEQTPDARTRQQQWEKAVKQFEGATQLDPADTDARDNLEFVRQKLEELKQQQQQQQQQQQPSSQNQKDQQQDQDQSKQNQDQSQPDQKDSGKDQQQKPDAQQQQSPSPQQDQPSQSPDEKKDSPQSDSKDQAGQDQKDQQQQSSSQQSQQSGQQPQPSGQGEGKPGDTQDEKGKPQTAVGQMTTRQAEQLLDAQKGNERALIFLPAKPGAPKGRIIKDW